MYKKLTVLAFIVFSISTTSMAQSYKAMLLKDLVKVSGSKMIFEDFTLITFSNGNTMQVKTHSEGPSTGVISRDNFVFLNAHISSGLIENITEQDPEAKTKEMGAIIGNPDVSINIYVAREGIQVEANVGGEVRRDTLSWEEFFK